MAENQFWHQRQLQPKRKFRWIATVGDGETVYSYVVKKVAKPTWNSANKEHKILGHTFNFPGPVTWDTVDLTIVDLAGDKDSPERGNAAVYLQNLIYASGYQFPTSLDNASLGVTKARAASALGGLGVQQLDAEGFLLEEYTFHNPWIEKVDFGGEFDYESDDFVDVTLTVRFDWAKIIAPAGEQLEIGPEAQERLEAATLDGNSYPVGHRPKNSDSGGGSY
jgi:hypothetical protein